MPHFKLSLFLGRVLKGFHYYLLLIPDNYFINIEMCMNTYLMTFLKKIKKKLFCVKKFLITFLFYCHYWILSNCVVIKCFEGLRS